jgi:hypothetical protein
MPRSCTVTIRGIHNLPPLVAPSPVLPTALDETVCHALSVVEVFHHHALNGMTSCHHSAPVILFHDLVCPGLSVVEVFPHHALNKTTCHHSAPVILFQDLVCPGPSNVDVSPHHALNERASARHSGPVALFHDYRPGNFSLRRPARKCFDRDSSLRNFRYTVVLDMSLLMGVNGNLYPNFRPYSFFAPVLRSSACLARWLQ